MKIYLISLLFPFALISLAIFSIMLEFHYTLGEDIFAIITFLCIVGVLINGLR